MNTINKSNNNIIGSSVQRWCIPISFVDLRYFRPCCSFGSAVLCFSLILILFYQSKRPLRHRRRRVGLSLLNRFLVTLLVDDDGGWLAWSSSDFQTVQRCATHDKNLSLLAPVKYVFFVHRLRRSVPFHDLPPRTQRGNGSQKLVLTTDGSLKFL